MTASGFWLILRKEVGDTFSAAINSGNLTYGGRRSKLLGALLGFALLSAVSFFMLWLGDRINAPGMAVTRFMARTQAPLTSEFAYPENAREQISVILYDRQFLDSQGAAWPISYQEHADWLSRLVELPGAKPKALMLDISFGQERNDPSIAALRDKLCEIRKVHQIPVYLAALPHSQTGQLSVRAGLAAGDGAGPDECFTLVGVDYVPDPLDGLAWSYQLNRFFDGNSWVPGKPTDGLAPHYRSAALAMAEDSGGLKLAENPEPMAMMWGFRSAQQSDRPDLNSGCAPGEFKWVRWIPGLIRQIWESADKPALCPYHRTLSFAQVAEMEEATLSRYVADKFVFVGAQVPGYNDFANSPVHGLVPGVHMHAMALDNFLSYGANYKISAEWTVPPHPELLVPGLVSVAIVFLVNLGWHTAKERFGVSKSKAPAPACPLQSRSSLAQRVRESLGIGFIWVLRISVQSVVAIFLISLLQTWFRIGMLPVVELVGMTLVADGLGYMARIRWFIWGPLDNELCQRKKEQADEISNPPVDGNRCSAEPVCVRTRQNLGPQP